MFFVLASFVTLLYLSNISECSEDTGKVLFVTPHIESGDVKQARNLMEVIGLPKGVKCYTGYFTVNKTYNSNLFLWYFPAESFPEQAPVVVYLLGGPGSTCAEGIFEENGPLYFRKDCSVAKREDHYWSKVFNMIYIDSPVGTGYSFTDNDEGYARNEETVGRDLYTALMQFFRLFPNLQKNHFFISGESYGGKFTSALAYTIHTNNQKSDQKINLKGLTISAGFTDPENMMIFSEYLYQTGMIDAAGSKQFAKYEKYILKAIRQKKYMKAFHLFDSMIKGDIVPRNMTLYYNLTGYYSYYNVLHLVEETPNGDFLTCVQDDRLRAKIHVGNRLFHFQGSEVKTYLREEFMMSAKPWIEKLLEHYRILIYNGQVDIIVAYPFLINSLNTYRWSGAKKYNTAKRKKFKVGGTLAGYYKTAKTLTEVLIRNAGHFLSKDQPYWSMELLTRFVFGKNLGL